MINKIKNFFKDLYCIHKWEHKVTTTGSNNNGTKVCIETHHCAKCNGYKKVNCNG